MICSRSAVTRSLVRPRGCGNSATRGIPLLPTSIVAARARGAVREVWGRGGQHTMCARSLSCRYEHRVGEWPDEGLTSVPGAVRLREKWHDGRRRDGRGAPGGGLRRTGDGANVRGRAIGPGVVRTGGRRNVGRDGGGQGRRGPVGRRWDVARRLRANAAALVAAIARRHGVAAPPPAVGGHAGLGRRRRHLGGAVWSAGGTWRPCAPSSTCATASITGRPRQMPPPCER